MSNKAKERYYDIEVLFDGEWTENFYNNRKMDKLYSK